MYASGDPCTPVSPLLLSAPLGRQPKVNYRTPMLQMTDLSFRHRRHSPEMEASVLRVVRSGRYIGGEVVAQAETSAAKLFQRELAVGVNSGTDGLILALQALGVSKGDEVIIPAVSFFATAGAVLAIGARPITVDITPSGCMNPDLVSQAVNASTRAIIPVHLYGTRCPLPQTSIPIIDDAAQAAGATRPRSQGTITVLSTYPTKTWGGLGDGGFVLGDDPALMDDVRCLANHGWRRSTSQYDTVRGHAGRNSRLDAIQAAALLEDLNSLTARIEIRRATATFYDEFLPKSLARVPRDDESPVHQYAIRVRNRKQFRARLLELGVQSAVYYADPLHTHPMVEQRHPTPIADAFCKEITCLPIHAGISEEDRSKIVRAVERSL